MMRSLQKTNLILCNIQPSHRGFTFFSHSGSLNNSILRLSDLGGFTVFWPLKCLIQDQMHLALDLYLLSHLISSLYTHIHIFDCLNCASLMSWCVCGHSVECEGWTVTCWWWVTYCSTYEHVSNIAAGRGRGCRTAQLLNHLRSFSHQHTSEDQDRVGTAFCSATHSHHTQDNNISPIYFQNHAQVHTDAGLWGKTKWGVLG